NELLHRPVDQAVAPDAGEHSPSLHVVHRAYSAFTPSGTARLPARANVGHERNVTRMQTPIVTEVRRGSPYVAGVAYRRVHDHYDDERPSGLPDRRGLRRGLRAHGS